MTSQRAQLSPSSYYHTHPTVKTLFCFVLFLHFEKYKNMKIILPLWKPALCDVTQVVLLILDSEKVQPSTLFSRKCKTSIFS